MVPSLSTGRSFGGGLIESRKDLGEYVFVGFETEPWSLWSR